MDYCYPNHPEPKAEPGDMGEVSDGYHTFNELYRYRMLYNAAFFNLLARNGQVEVCKSRRHSDGEKCFGSDDWFIVMAILPTGQVSNHYKSKYWDLFDVPERETAFEYDGHTPNEAADRLEKYLKLPRHGMTFEKALEQLKLGRKIKRIDWGKKYKGNCCMRSYMGSRSQEQASRSSKYTIRNRILWIETLFYNIATCRIRHSP